MFKKFSTLEIVHIDEIRSIPKGYYPIDGPDLMHFGSVGAAYRDYFGFLKETPKFLVQGPASASATFAIAALAGLLPHPSRGEELASSAPPVRESGVKDLTQLAQLIGRHELYADTVRLEEESWGGTLLLWQQLGWGAEGSLAFYGGVDRWRMLTWSQCLEHLFTAARNELARRRLRAEQARRLLADR
jgi:hypothetical protein